MHCSSFQNKVWGPFPCLQAKEPGLFLASSLRLEPLSPKQFLGPPSQPGEG